MGFAWATRARRATALAFDSLGSRLLVLIVVVVVVVVSVVAVVR